MQSIHKKGTAILQVFMRHKISESYCVFNGEYFECIKNFKNKKKTYKKLNTFHAKASEKTEFFYLNCFQQGNRYSKKLKA